ncbi:MAG: hypothetical protein WCS91_02955 [Bacilli bacterium]
MSDFQILSKAIYANSYRVGSRNRKGMLSNWNDRNNFLGQMLIGLLVSFFCIFSLITACISARDAGATTEEMSSLFYTMYAGFFGAQLFILLVYNRAIYFQSKLEALFPLPISNRKLFLAQYTICLKETLFFEGFAVILSPIIFAIFIKAGTLAIVFSVLFSLTVGIGLSLLDFILLVLLSRIIPLEKNIPGMVFDIFAGILAAGFFSFGNLLIGNNGAFIGRMGNYQYFLTWPCFLLSRFATESPDQGLYFLAYVGVLFGLILLSLLLASLLYLKKKKTRLPKEAREDKAKQKKDVSLSLSKAFQKARKPVFFETLLSFRSIPGNAWFVNFTQGVSVCIAGIFLFAFPSQDSFPSMVPPILATVFLYESLFCPYLSYASLSLEQQNFVYLKTVPFAPDSYLKAKRLPGILCGLVYSLLPSIVFGILSHMGVLGVFALLLSGFAYTLSYNSIAFLLGIRYVNFNYSNFNELFSRGMGPFLLAIIGIFYPALGVLTVLPFAFLDPSYIPLGIVLGGLIYLGLYFLFRTLTKKAFHKLLKKEISL